MNRRGEARVIDVRLLQCKSMLNRVSCQHTPLFRRRDRGEPGTAASPTIDVDDILYYIGHSLPFINTLCDVNFHTDRRRRDRGEAGVALVVLIFISLYYIILYHYCILYQFLC